MHSYAREGTNMFGSSRLYFLLLLYRVVGTTNTLALAPAALESGALGTILCFIFTCFFMGVPLLYMELVVSQFTSRDVIDMWKIRPCLSHFGYFVIGSQIYTLMYNHAITTTIVHYLLISFESPQPFFVCGDWSTSECMILRRNYTANKYCIKYYDESSFCQKIHESFPEYQYYKNNLFRGSSNSRPKYFYLPWSMCLASGITAVVTLLSCIKGVKSMRWFAYTFTIFPVVGYVILLVGSMQQRGFIDYYAESLDTNFRIFLEEMRLTNVMEFTVYSLGAGTGIYSNLASLAPFRAPCYAHAVSSVLYAVAFTTLIILVSAMMPCPFAFEFSTHPHYLIDITISFVFIKVPKMLLEYYTPRLWLVLFYSIQTLLSITNNIIIYFTLLEVLAKRSEKIRKYTAAITICTMVILFLTSLPIIGFIGKNVLVPIVRKCLFLLTTYFALCESIAFILWYGFGRFCDDIHFMQGLQPKTGIKICWMLVTFALAYILCVEFSSLFSLWYDIKMRKTETRIFWFMAIVIAASLLMTGGKLAWAALQGRFLAQLKVVPRWGPQDDVLRRSRAMFTAHAMTKEYMYRQYHLQAGILARQQRSNVRLHKAQQQRSSYATDSA